MCSCKGVGELHGSDAAVAEPSVQSTSRPSARERGFLADGFARLNEAQIAQSALNYGGSGM